MKYYKGVKRCLYCKSIITSKRSNKVYCNTTCNRRHYDELHKNAWGVSRGCLTNKKKVEE